MTSSGDLLPCMTSQFEYFTKKPVQSCVLGHVTETIKPLAALQDSHTDIIEFFSAPRPLQFLDLNDVQLKVTCYLRTKSNGMSLATSEGSCSVVNAPLHSMFSQCEVFLPQ